MRGSESAKLGPKKEFSCAKKAKEIYNLIKNGGPHVYSNKFYYNIHTHSSVTFFHVPLRSNKQISRKSKETKLNISLHLKTGQSLSQMCLK